MVIELLAYGIVGLVLASILSKEVGKLTKSYQQNKKDLLPKKVGEKTK